MKDIANYSLLGHNTFGIDAKCDRFVEYATIEDAQELACTLSRQKQHLLIIGKGSNLLLTDDFHGTVLHSAIKGIETLPTNDADTVLLRCGSGETWDDVVAKCVENGWYGIENLSLIPGEVGASAIQNIGAYGAEAKDFVFLVEAVDIETGEKVTLKNSECRYAYRDSIFKHEWKNRFLITHVTYKLSKIFTPELEYGNIRKALDDKGIGIPTAKELRETIIEIRRAKLPDPEMLGNAGSFFMNPIVDREIYCKLLSHYGTLPHYDIDERHVKIPAGWLIEQCGWKGRALGNAGVHDKQALVLVNLGKAKGSDILALSNRIISDVKDKFGIDIHPEVNVV